MERTRQRVANSRKGNNMRIKRVELRNFRSISHLMLENLPDTIVLVSANGLGKSTILEAIAAAHDLVVPYHQDHYGFRESWQGNNTPVWPPHLRKPVRFGSAQASLSIEVQPNDREQAFLRAARIDEPVGKAHFVIEQGRYIKTASVNDAIRKLFEFHPPTLGLGFLDYIPPIRYYPNQGVGDINSAGSDQQLRQIVASFHRGWTDTSKFGTLKTFIVASIVNDTTETRETGVPVDSLATFRDTFDHFFSPKRFIGPKRNPESGQVEILVQTPFGFHDIDYLSDGEKEVLNVLGYLYQFRDLESIFLWDTPESHLNASLESRLYYALRQLAPRNQLWLSTHSLELIGAVPPECLFVLRQTNDGVTVEQPNDSGRRARVAIYRELGASVGLQLVSSLVVFVEGKESNSDKRILDRLIGAAIPAVNFVAVGGCDGILAIGSRANKLLEEACANGDFLAIMDRDYRDDSELESLEKKYCNRVFLWRVHEIENLFLQPSIVYETLKYHDQLGNFHTPEDILNALRVAAKELREWIAADWVRWSLHQQLKRPSGQIAATSPLQSLREYGARVRKDAQQLAAVADLDKQYAERLAEVDRFLGSDKWLQRLPGKQILRRFLTQYTTLIETDYLPTAVSTLIEKKIPLPEVERLKTILQTSIGRSTAPAT
jgi:predicted ATPase